MSASRSLKMYEFNGKVNWGQVICPRYRGCLLLRESVTGAVTVKNCTENFYPYGFTIIPNSSQYFHGML